MNERTDKKSPSLAKLLLNLFRWGLCAVAVYLLYNAISWHDRVRLEGPDGPYVRLVNVTVDEQRFEIEKDGGFAIVDRSEIHLINGEVPDIKYGIAGVVRNLNYGWALVAILIFGPVPILSAFRLIWMLQIQEVRLSLWNSIKLTYAGNFFNFALPGTTGGDLIKAYYLTRYTQHKTEAVTTVFLDRVIGLLGLVILAGSMILISWDPERFGQVATVLAIVLAGLIAGALVVFSKRLRHAVGLPKLAARLPAGEQLLRIGRAFTKMREHKLRVLASLLITVTLQFLVMLAVYEFALALQMDAEFRRYLIYVPICFLIAALPIGPPQGVGVLEWFYVQFFTANGMNSVSQAFALALASRLIQLVWALPGVLVPLLGAHLPSKAELATLESANGDASNGDPEVAALSAAAVE